jgi:hypothetical protein
MTSSIFLSTFKYSPPKTLIVAEPAPQEPKTRRGDKLFLVSAVRHSYPQLSTDPRFPHVAVFRVRRWEKIV